MFGIRINVLFEFANDQRNKKIFLKRFVFFLINENIVKSTIEEELVRSYVDNIWKEIEHKYCESKVTYQKTHKY